MADEMTSAAEKVCAEFTPVLQSYAREAGMEAPEAASLRLVWDGSSFSANSSQDLSQAEFGDGKGPSPRPIHKALNRLSAEVQERMTDLVVASFAEQLEQVPF